MEHKLNVEPLFNVQLQLNNMLAHVMLSFNTKQPKYVLSDNSNVLASPQKTHKPTFNVMVHLFWMLKLWYNKHVLLVLLKTS